MTFRRIWLTADWHLGHKNIITYCKRPFKDTDEMDKTILENHNSLVGKDDLVYFLGDLAFYKDPKAYLEKFLGEFSLIKGNHDRQTFFKARPEYSVIGYGGLRIKLMHDPMFADKKYDLNLCGHVHEKWKVRSQWTPQGRFPIINIGVDVWGFKPVALDDLLRQFQKGEFVAKNAGP